MNREAKKAIKRVNLDEKGLTLLEYAAGAAFVLIIATAVFTLFGQSLNGLFGAMDNNLQLFEDDLNGNTSPSGGNNNGGGNTP